MRRLALVTLMGCSIATSGAPRNYDGRTPPACTTSKVLPALDLTAAVFAGLVSIPLLYARNQCESVDGDCDQTGPKIANVFGKLFLIGGGLYALSSLAGFSNVRSCRAAVREYEGK